MRYHQMLGGTGIESLKPHPHHSPHVLCAFQGDLAVMEGCAVLDDGETQACAADFFGMVFVHTIKPLEHPLNLMLHNSSRTNENSKT